MDVPVVWLYTEMTRFSASYVYMFDGSAIVLPAASYMTSALRWLLLLNVHCQVGPDPAVLKIKPEPKAPKRRKRET